MTKFRPVPLSWQFCYQREDQARLLPLLAKKGRALNPQLQPPPSEKYLGVDWGRFDKLKSAQLQYAFHTQSCSSHSLFCSAQKGCTCKLQLVSTYADWPAQCPG